MRNYWVKILLGALAIFAVGMIGVTLARRGIAGVERVVASDQPLTIPLGLVPFELQGERLGKLDHVTLMRKSPQEVTAVELEINLTDSLVARGLAGCRLVANMETKGDSGIDIRVGPHASTVFYCAGANDSSTADLLEYGHATLQPGGIEIPLLLTRDVVKELQHIDFGKGNPAEATAEQADSIEEANQDRADSIQEAVQEALARSGQDRRQAMDSIKTSLRHFGDSLRAVGLREAEAGRRQADSAQREADAADRQAAAAERRKAARVADSSAAR
jgi:hypothetical protein